MMAVILPEVVARLASLGIIVNTNGIGVGLSPAASVPISSLSVGSGTIKHSADGGTIFYTLQSYVSSASSSSFNLDHIRGSVSSPAALSQNDVIGDFGFRGASGAATIRTGVLLRSQVIAVTPSETDFGSRLSCFIITGGTVTQNEMFRFDQATGFSLQGANPVIDQNRLIRTRVYTVATLPTAVEGAFAFVSDATLTTITGLGLAPIGGGSNHVPVYADNVGWKIL